MSIGITSGKKTVVHRSPAMAPSAAAPLRASLLPVLCREFPKAGDAPGFLPGVDPVERIGLIQSPPPLRADLHLERMAQDHLILGEMSSGSASSTASSTAKSCSTPSRRSAP